MRTTPKASVVLLAASALFLATGCERQDPVQVYKAPKEPAARPVLASASEAPDPDHSAENPDAELTWTAPLDWRTASATQFATAAFATPDGLTATVSPLARAGGAVLPNINRWERQLGLPPTAEADLPKVTAHLHVGPLEALGVDLAGPSGNRLLAVIIPAGAQTYFFKLMGPADKVAAQKANFDAWVKSIRPAGAPQPRAEAPKVDAPKPDAPKVEAPKPPAPAAAAADSVKIPGIASYVLPAGWQVDATPKPMRAATITVTRAGVPATLIVTTLRAGAFGDKLMNLNRWRGQVGLPPADNADTPAKELKLAQGPADLMEFVGPDAADRKRQLVAVTKFPDAKSTWFFRFIGPDDVVAKSADEFAAFLGSLKFEE